MTKLMYVMMEVDMKIDFFRGGFTSIGKGIDIDSSEDVDLLLDTMCKRMRSFDSCAFTFGDDMGIDMGYGIQYGRIFRLLSEVEVVFWDHNGHITETRKIGERPDRRMLRKLVMEMINKHKQQTEADS